MASATLRQQYIKRYNLHLVHLAEELENHIKDTLKDCPRIDRIAARAKSIDRFLKKAEKIEKGKKKYTDPLNQIQDQIGARIITFYLDDVDRVSKIINDFFSPIEALHHVPDSVSKFGYEGKHYILFLPEDIIDATLPSDEIPKFFELQIKTLFQHAWGEANHDLGYKPERELTKEEQRKMAFTAAQAWGADMIFDELFLAQK
jgi:ppGpp synthetase/RelA/SpoT-type nucleotidyltranferase